MTEEFIRKAIDSMPYGEEYKELRYLLHQALAIAKIMSKKGLVTKRQECVEYERHETNS